jgi:hypothetical protein
MLWHAKRATRFVVRDLLSVNEVSPIVPTGRFFLPAGRIACEQTDDAIHIFLFADPDTDPTGIGIDMMRFRFPVRYQLIANGPGKRKVSQPIFMQMAQFLSPIAKFNSPEAVRRFTDSRPSGQRLADAISGIHPVQAPFLNGLLWVNNG